MLLPIPSADAGSVTRIDRPDGSFGFELPELEVNGFRLPSIGPGDTIEFGYEYFARASTGFGETGVFAAIGDPFNLTVGGGRFDLLVGDSPNEIPEPGTLTTFGLGLVIMLTFSVYRRRACAPPHVLVIDLGVEL